MLNQILMKIGSSRDWKEKYGGMDVSQAQEKQVRDENTRLRKLVADLKSGH